MLYKSKRRETKFFAFFFVRCLKIQVVRVFSFFELIGEPWFSAGIVIAKEEIKVREQCTNTKRSKRTREWCQGVILAHGAAGSIVAARRGLAVVLQFTCLLVVGIAVRKVMRVVGVHWCWRHMRQAGVGRRVIHGTAGRGHPGLLCSGIGISTVVGMRGGSGHVVVAMSRSEAIGGTIGRRILILVVAHGTLVDWHNLAFLEAGLVGQRSATLEVLLRGQLHLYLGAALSAGGPALVGAGLVEGDGLRDVAAGGRGGGDGLGDGHGRGIPAGCLRGGGRGMSRGRSLLLEAHELLEGRGEIGLGDAEVKVEEGEKLFLHEVDLADGEDGRVSGPMLVLGRLVVQVLCCNDERGQEDTMASAVHA